MKVLFSGGIILFLNVLTLLMFPHRAYSQGGNSSEEFLQNEVYSIYVNADIDSIQIMYETLESEHTFPANTTIISSLDSVNMLCGFRLRGNTSLNAAKKSFRISFDSYDNNQDWRGLSDINLIALHNDPSIMRAKLCYDLFRSQGIAAPRTSYAALFLNEQYMGLYLMTEPIDEIFSKNHLDQQGDGNLFKCTYPATLEYLGTDPNLYKFEMWGRRMYELKNNLWLDNYSSFSDFISFIHNPASNLNCYNENPFHFNQYITCAALEILLGHWDNYIFNKNNFYLYHHELTNKYYYIPYDVDNTLGIDWVGEDWTQRNIYAFHPSGESRPLYEIILNNPEARNHFSNEILRLCNTVYHPDSITNKINFLRNLIAPYVAADPFYPLDYGFTYSDFMQSADQAAGNQVQYGIIPFITARRNSALQQLETLTNDEAELQFQYIITHSSHSEIFGRIQENAALLPLQIEIAFDGNTPAYYDVNYINSTDFHATIIHPENSNHFYYRILSGNNDLSCGTLNSWITPQADAIRINEILCENFSFNTDEFGEYDDWVEITNTSNETVLLNGYYLTDDSTNWNKFILPNVSIPANSYMIFWMDKDPETGTYHGTFNLSQGETVSLMKLIDNVPRFVDSITLDSCYNDVSFARNETTNQWFFSNPPTPATYNYILTNISDQTTEPLRMYNGIIQLHHPDNIRIIDISGRVVAQCRNCSDISLQGISTGYYILHTDSIQQPFHFQQP